ncbi:MAG TPA: ATP-dependent Clp protease ATP-binding subunit ClpX, partial [Ruminococcus sp.]|nr:ATP-dependent Clp protease ATP-binding subunit ClpX [Ruminococcus sp.]
FSYDNIELEVQEDALIEIAKKAIAQKTGARGLRSILEHILMNTMYSVPTAENVVKVVVNADCVINNTQPLMMNSNNQEIKAV